MARPAITSGPKPSCDGLPGFLSRALLMTEGYRRGEGSLLVASCDRMLSFSPPLGPSAPLFLLGHQAVCRTSGFQASGFLPFACLPPFDEVLRPPKVLLAHRSPPSKGKRSENGGSSPGRLANYEDSQHPVTAVHSGWIHTYLHTETKLFLKVDIEERRGRLTKYSFILFLFL